MWALQRLHSSSPATSAQRTAACHAFSGRYFETGHALSLHGRLVLQTVDPNTNG